jgi:hypothetical protein
MSEVKVNKISPRSGTDVTLGDSGDTFTIPAGATLTNNGTASGFGIAWQSDIKTSAFTAVAGEGYWVNTTSGAVTVTLPASASVGDTIEFTDYARTWATNNLTLNPNSLNYQGNSSPNPVYDTNGQHVRIVYSGATQGWIPTVDDDVSLETPQNATADILVVAGGGSGGNTTTGTQYSSGGGAAGGYRSFTSETLLAGSTYTIVVGGGGSPVANGSDSSISGTGISYTSAGGGYGGTGDNTANAGNAGGSGGGGGGGSGATGGAGNTPSTSPSQGNNGGSGDSGGNTFAGGGGGAGAVGGNHNSPSNLSGNGGNGLQNSITGTATYYAGGGGGGAGYSGGTSGGFGAGGLGGGGDGSGSGVGQNGTANTGGGAGGSRGTFGVASGGSGVVILRLPTSVYSGTTTGSPTVSVDGTDTVLTFTGSGSYTQ